MRSYLILNLARMNDLPLMERWLLRDHCAETLSQLDPILDRYVSYRAVPPPAGAEAFACYNWRMTEHWWRESPFPAQGQDNAGASLSERWPAGYTEILGLPSGEHRSAQWHGAQGGPHPPAFVFVTRRPSEDFKGRGLTLDDGTILRWLNAIKYPEGVTVKEGDAWYVHVHAPELCRQPGLKRFFSSRAVEPRVGPWARVSELWYEDEDAWRRATIEQPSAMTAPPWATDARAPYLRPWVDLVSMFILERPTNDFKRDYAGYVTTA